MSKKTDEIKDIEIADFDAEEIEAPNDEDDVDVEEETNTRKPINIHLIIWGAILLIIVIIVVSLLIWDKGTKSDYDPNNVTEEYDVEVLDNIIPLDPAKLEGHEDDGVTTILCLGGDPFAYDKSETGIAQKIAQKTGATVYDGSFLNSTATAECASYNDGVWMDALTFAYVCDSLCLHDFDKMTFAAEVGYDANALPTVQMLSNLDMNTVDMIVIAYDMLDYQKLRPSDDEGDDTNIRSYAGALRNGIQNIQENFPWIRIVVMSHTFCFTIGDDGNFANADRVDWGNGTISHYLLKEIDATSDCGVSFIDNFYGAINEENYYDYMVDYMHFNEAGNEVLANRFVECIFPELVVE